MLLHLLFNAVPEIVFHDRIYPCITYNGKLPVGMSDVKQYAIAIFGVVNIQLLKDESSPVEHIAFAMLLNKQTDFSGGLLLRLFYGSNDFVLLLFGKKSGHQEEIKWNADDTDSADLRR